MGITSLIYELCWTSVLKAHSCCPEVKQSAPAHLSLPACLGFKGQNCGSGRASRSLMSCESGMVTGVFARSPMPGPASEMVTSQAALGKFVQLCCASVSPSIKWLATLPEPWGTWLPQCCQPGEELRVQRGWHLAHTGAPRLLLQPLWGNPVGMVLGREWKQVSPSTCSQPGLQCWVRNSPG